MIPPLFDEGIRIVDEATVEPRKLRP